MTNGLSAWISLKMRSEAQIKAALSHIKNNLKGQLIGHFTRKGFFINKWTVNF